MSIFDELAELTEEAKDAAAAPYGYEIDRPAGLDVPPPGSENLVAQGDNLEFMRLLLSQRYGGSVGFIYADPPFYTGEDRKGKSEGGTYKDRWESLSEYLKMLTFRLSLMRELLADDGLIAVHLDYRTVHYVKVIMDELFGPDRMVNELIWTYKSGGAGNRSFAKKHDTILLYSKTADYYFSVSKEKSYNREGRPYRFKGVEEFEDENGWYTLVNRKDVFSVNMVGRTAAERTGYPTQKPLALLSILLSSCAKPSALCADFFCGSGTLPLAASAAGHPFIACDSGAAAVSVTKKRLLDAGATFLTMEMPG